MHATLATPGALNLSGLIRADDLGDSWAKSDSPRGDSAASQSPLFTQDPEGTEKHLLDTLAAAQFDVDRTGDPAQGTLNDYQLVVFNNQDLESLVRRAKMRSRNSSSRVADCS